MSLRSNQIEWINTAIFLLSNIFWWEFTAFCLTMQVLRSMLSVFDCSNYSCYEYLCESFCMNIHFFLINAQNFDYWIIYYFLKKLCSFYSFQRNCQNIFQNTVPFCIPWENGWEILFLSIILIILHSQYF